MADWKTVRFDPNYEEKLDPEIVELCDALNEAGFTTTCSCCGHGVDWARVWIEHSTDERLERLARFVKAREQEDFRPHFTVWDKEILYPQGYSWMVEVHCNEVYGDTPTKEFLQKTISALAQVTEAVKAFAQEESTTS